MTERLRLGFLVPSLPRVEVSSRVSYIHIMSFAILNVGIYTDIPLFIGAGTVPSISVLPGLILAALVPQIWSMNFFKFVFVPALVMILISIFSPDIEEMFSYRFNSVIQFTYALVIGYVWSFLALGLGRKRIGGAVGVILPILCCLIVLEIFTPFREVVVGYLDVYPREYDFISMAAREENIGGGYRPKLFTSETSYLAFNSVLVVITYIWTSVAKSKYAFAIFYIIVLTALIRSPIVPLALPVVIVSAIFGLKLETAKSASRAGVAIASVFAVSLVATVSADLVAARWESITSGRDYSTTYRTYGSLYAGFEVVARYPVFGVGPGNLDLARDEILGTYAALGVPYAAAIREWRMSLNNALAASLVYFGIFGTVIVCTSAFLFVRYNILQSIAPLLSAVFVLSLTTGAIYTPKFASMFIILVALARLREERVGKET